MADVGMNEVVRLTYTVDEVSVLLGLSRNQTYEFVRQGVIPARRVGRRWVIARRALHEWLEGCRVEPVQPSKGAGSPWVS